MMLMPSDTPTPQRIHGNHPSQRGLSRDAVTMTTAQRRPRIGFKTRQESKPPLWLRYSMQRPDRHKGVKENARWTDLLMRQGFQSQRLSCRHRNAAVCQSELRQSAEPPLLHQTRHLNIYTRTNTAGR
ncbi:hypothetical protein AOLI_G00221710 [Acnodon oligacanthus]